MSRSIARITDDWPDDMPIAAVKLYDAIQGYIRSLEEARADHDGEDYIWPPDVRAAISLEVRQWHGMVKAHLNWDVWTPRK